MNKPTKEEEKEDYLTSEILEKEDTKISRIISVISEGSKIDEPGYFNIKMENGDECLILINAISKLPLLRNNESVEYTFSVNYNGFGEIKILKAFSN